MKNLVFILMCAMLASCGSGSDATVASTGEHINGPVKKVSEFYDYGSRSKSAVNENSMEFDKDGKQTGGASYMAEGSYTRTVTYHFGKPGILEKAVMTFGSEMGAGSVRRFNYDDKGRIATIVDEISEGDGGASLSMKTECEYDGKGRLVREKHYDEHGALSGRMSVEYDSKGNVSKTKQQDVDGSSTTTETLYSYGNYDKHDNWLTCEISNSGKDVTRLKREITYY